MRKVIKRDKLIHVDSASALMASECQLCSEPTIEEGYDARTNTGRWGWLCRPCFERVGTGLGLGKGQHYRVDPTIADIPEPTESYDSWLKQADFYCIAKYGLSIHDLPDQPWMDWYTSLIRFF